MTAVTQQALEELASRLFPGATLLHAEPLGPDAAGDEKAAGYGRPVRVTLRLPGGIERRFVFRTQASNEFGHDRRADRAEAALLAYDLFGRFPDHVRALDVGAVAADGRLVSLRRRRRVRTSPPAGRRARSTPRTSGAWRARGAARSTSPAARRSRATWRGSTREALDDPAAWRRAVRDLLGHGEGIFGDGRRLPGGRARRRRRPGSGRSRSAAWPPAGRSGGGRRASRAPTATSTRSTSSSAPPAAGEDGARFTLLDASRGGRGDPADDVVALSVNYLFFALEHPGAWARGLGAAVAPVLGGLSAGSATTRGSWRRAPPYLAWRALVLCCPRFYPRLGPAARDALLGLAERTLDAGRLDLADVEPLFAAERGP